MERINAQAITHNRHHNKCNQMIYKMAKECLILARNHVQLTKIPTKVELLE